MDYKFVMLQEAAGQGGGLVPNLLMFGLIGIVFYFFMIRPQLKRTKEAKKYREGIAQGDKVVTIGGIQGKVLEVADTTILISSDGTKLRIEKSAISPNGVAELGQQQR